MEIIGTIKVILPQQSGVSAKTGRTWTNQEIVITYNEESQHPNDVLLNCQNKVIEALPQFPVGTKVKCTFDPNANEYNGKWFNKLNCWKIERA